MDSYKKHSKQVQTERGLICVVHNFDTPEEALKNGYGYAFTSSMLQCDVYSMCLDDRGFYHEFVTVSPVKKRHVLTKIADTLIGHTDNKRIVISTDDLDEVKMLLYGARINYSVE